MSHKRIVYLAGPINGCTDEECNDWRQYATARLTAVGVGVKDPMERDYRGREMEPGIAAEIVENDKADIEGSDAVIANCPTPSVGTSQEILFSWERDKPVVVVHPADAKPSPWLVYHAAAVVPTMAAAIDAIQEALS